MPGSLRIRQYGLALTYLSFPIVAQSWQLSGHRITSESIVVSVKPDEAFKLARVKVSFPFRCVHIQVTPTTMGICTIKRLYYESN